MTQLVRSRHRLVQALIGTIVAMLAFAAPASGDEQPVTVAVQASAAVTPATTTTPHQPSVQDVSDALGQRLEQIVANKRPVSVR